MCVKGLSLGLYLGPVLILDHLLLMVISAWAYQHQVFAPDLLLHYTSFPPLHTMYFSWSFPLFVQTAFAVA